MMWVEIITYVVIWLMTTVSYDLCCHMTYDYGVIWLTVQDELHARGTLAQEQDQDSDEGEQELEQEERSETEVKGYYSGEEGGWKWYPAGGKDPPRGREVGGLYPPGGRGGREEGGWSEGSRQTDRPDEMVESDAVDAPLAGEMVWRGGRGSSGSGVTPTASSSAVTYVQSVPLNIMRVISIAIASSKTIYGYCSQLVPKWIKGIQYCMQCGTWWQKPWQKWWYFSIFFEEWWYFLIFVDILLKNADMLMISQIFLMQPLGRVFLSSKVLKYYHFHSLHAMCHQLHLLFFVIINWHHLVLFINWHHLVLFINWHHLVLFINWHHLVLFIYFIKLHLWLSSNIWKGGFIFGLSSLLHTWQTVIQWLHFVSNRHPTRWLVTKHDPMG